MQKKIKMASSTLHFGILISSLSHLLFSSAGAGHLSERHTWSQHLLPVHRCQEGARPWLHRTARVSQTPVTAALTGWSAPVRMSPYRSSRPSPAPWSISASRPPSTASWTRRQRPAPSLSTHPHGHLMLKLRCRFLKKRSVYPASKRTVKKLCSQCRRAARVSSDWTDQMYTFREMLLRIPKCNIM